MAKIKLKLKNSTKDQECFSNAASEIQFELFYSKVNIINKIISQIASAIYFQISQERIFFITAWEVAHDRKNHYPHISLRDTLG